MDREQTSWRREFGVLVPLFALVPVSTDAKRNLLRLYSAEGRHYHGTGHLEILWARHHRFASAARLDSSAIHRLIASAIAYHDAVYDTRWSDNESRSAELWCQDSADSTIEPGERAWVADTIRATADHLGYRPDIDAADLSLPVTERARIWMLDLDLTPLGEAAAAFEANAALLRLENSGRPEVAHDLAERAFLERILAAPRIYRSPVLAAVFESEARRNIARRLARN